MTNEDLSYLFTGGRCSSDYDLFDEKEGGCRDYFCTNCWEKALEMEYEQ